MKEYFDEETYDFSKNRVDTFPLLIKNINKFKAREHSSNYFSFL